MVVMAGALWASGAVSADEATFAALITDYLHSDDAERREAIKKELAQNRALVDVTEAEFEAFETALLAYQPPPLDLEEKDGVFAAFPITVLLPDGRDLPVLIEVPAGYRTERLWPMLLTMHGGPGRSPDDGKRGASRMHFAWSEAAAEAGWVIVSPAMSHVFVHGRPSPERLAYEILTTAQMEAILDAVARLIRIDPNRVVATGVSLGANFSIGYAAARPDRFAGIAPVSCEGEFRESLLRNLAHTPVFAISGARDRNIRTIEGPRAMNRILTGLGYDVVYREEAERGHEGFPRLYPEILRWAAKHRRNPHPMSVLRMPHQGIMPTSRRVHWLEIDTRQGVAVGEIKPGNRIEIMTRWARSVTVYLHDQLLDLDKPVVVTVNGELVFEGAVKRSILVGLEQARRLRDRGRAYPAAVRIDVPRTETSLAIARTWSDSLLSQAPEGPLSYWEHFAVGTLRERLPVVGFEAEPRSGEGEFSAFEVTAVDPEGPFHTAGLQIGDRLLEIGGEPFVRGRDLEHLRHWLERELGDARVIYPVLIERNARRLTLEAVLSLDPF